MRNKAPLALMEQVVMVLVFALSAALCLQGFALANRISARLENRNQAVALAQNAAELVKYYDGDYTHAAQQINDTLEENVLRVEIAPLTSASPLLGTAQIRVLHEEEIVFEITVAWQKEEQHAEK